MSAAASIPGHLIPTKLYPPRTPAQLVGRRRLCDQLDREERSLTLISAPAGYGKSTLAREWLESTGRPYAWLSLDEQDGDLDAILDYLIAAITTVFSGLGGETRQLLNSPQRPQPEKLADSLLRDLRDLTAPTFLALDDYHAVQDKDMHLFLSRLLQRLPANLHLVLITRSDPPLPLARMKGQGLLREIRANDLRFTAEESAELLAQLLGTALDESAVESLTSLTEGWVVGLRLAAIPLADSRDPHLFLQQVQAGGEKMISDYLIDEVLRRLPAGERELLLRTAVVDRFCGPLVEALGARSTAGITGTDFVSQLWSSNLFLIALDNRGDWFRFHHLFRQLLLQRLQRETTPEQLAGLHLMAGEWFAQAGKIEEALIHFAQAGNGDRAARLVEANAEALLNQDQLRVLEHWIGIVPGENQGRPGILVLQAIVAQWRNQIQYMVRALEAAQAALDSGQWSYAPAEKKAWQGAINAFQANSFIPDNTPESSLRSAVQALQQLKPSDKYKRSMAEFWRIYAMQQLGEFSGAVRLGQDLLAEHAGAADTRTMRLLLAQCAVYFGEAAWGLHNRAVALREHSDRSGNYTGLCWAYFLQGYALYQRNHLAEAEDLFHAGLDLRDFAHGRAVIDSYTGLVLTQMALGRLADAQESLDALRRYLVDRQAYPMLALADSLALRVGPLAGMPASAEIQAADYVSQLAADLWELPLLTRCAAIIKQGAVERLAEVEAVIADSLDFVRSRNNKRQMMQIYALQALLHEARGEREEALAALQTAVSLGQPGGMLRIFADMGSDLVPLLSALSERGAGGGYVRQILALLGAPAGMGGAAERKTAASATALSPEAAAVLADLTNREMEVLVLLGERLTNKEIAARLHISPHTVKKHTLVVYQKLNVSGRRGAVARARELGLY